MSFLTPFLEYLVSRVLWFLRKVGTLKRGVGYDPIGTLGLTASEPQQLEYSFRKRVIRRRLDMVWFFGHSAVSVFNNEQN